MTWVNSISGTEPHKEDFKYGQVGLAYFPQATEWELDTWARINLSDEEFELEYQGLFISDKRNYIKNHKLFVEYDLP